MGGVTHFNDIIYLKFGPEGYARLMSGDVALVQDPRMIEALEMLRRLSNYVEPLEKRKDKTWADAAAAVGQGKAGMQFMGDWAKGELAALDTASTRISIAASFPAHRSPISW